MGKFRSYPEPSGVPRDGVPIFKANIPTLPERNATVFADGTAILPSDSDPGLPGALSGEPSRRKAYEEEYSANQQEIHSRTPPFGKEPTRP